MYSMENRFLRFIVSCLAMMTQHLNEWELVQSIKNTIFSLNEENIIKSANSIIENYSVHPLSFNLLVSQIVYTLYVLRMNDSNLYLNFIQEIERIENNNSKILSVFINFLLNKQTQESYHLLEDIIENGLAQQEIIKNKKIKFIQTLYIKGEKYQTKLDKIIKNYKELKKNDRELHKRLIKEGHNPNEIAIIIRNDEIEKLQEISSQANFDFNQTIEPSLYERYDFINRWGVSLIDYAAFFGSVQCFKYLLMNGANIENTGKYAVASGNLEIIHLCEQNHSSFKYAYETAIEFHQNNIFKYIYENKLAKIYELEYYGEKCVLYHNYEIFTFLIENGMRIDHPDYNIIYELARNGNLYLVKYFLKNNKVPEDIIFFSIQSLNTELVQFLIDEKGIDINENIYLFFMEKILAI